MLGVLFVLVVLDEVLCEAARRHGMEVGGLLIYRGAHLAYPVEWEAVVRVGGARVYHRGRSHSPALALEPLAKSYGVTLEVGESLTETETEEERALQDVGKLAEAFGRLAKRGRPLARVTRTVPEEDEPGTYTVALSVMDGPEIISTPAVTLGACVRELARLINGGSP